MALIGNLTAIDNSYKEDLKNVYFKIEGVFLDTDKEKVRVPVRGYLSEFARHNQGIGVFKRVFYIPFDFFNNTKCNKSDLYKKAYEYISKLPEFKDCKNSLKKYKGKIEITEKTIKNAEKKLDDLIKELKGN